MSDEPVYLDASEAAAILKRPVGTLAYWRHRGEGPPYGKVGKRVLYRRADLLAWIESQFGDATDG